MHKKVYSSEQKRSSDLSSTNLHKPIGNLKKSIKDDHTFRPTLNEVSMAMAGEHEYFKPKPPPSSRDMTEVIDATETMRVVESDNNEQHWSANKSSRDLFDRQMHWVNTNYIDITTSMYPKLSPNNSPRTFRMKKERRGWRKWPENVN